MNNLHLSNCIHHPFRHFCPLRILPLLMLPSLPTTVQAQFNYTITNGAVTITAYTGPGGAVIIPDTIDGLPVTSIGQAAFIRTSLTAVTIPNGVISIGGWAFEQCASLASVVIPASVTSIGDGAFIWCTSLTAITIPNGVTNVAVGAFSNCSSLTNVTIPSSVISIDYQAFAYCDSLTSITIPNSVLNIGQGAFESCPSLTSITIPNSVTNIEYGALMDCGSLSAITVDALNPFYSSLDGVLFNKDNTMLLQYPGGRPGTYIVPNSVTTVGAGAFAYCTNLTNAPIGNSVTNIQYYAFYACMGLTSMTIPDSVTRIEFGAFSYCTGLTGVTCGNGVIGDGAFSYCTSLASATIGKGVTSIGEGAFANCEDLTGIYFQGNAPSLGGALVFDGDNNLIIYYLLGTTGWDPTFGGRPTALSDLHYT
ncbi:MAG: leucine-rich repeat domain-containing protein, partial [Limisphaerales bacterium]